MKGNESFLCKDDVEQYPILSELFILDHSVFSSSDMPALVKELNKIAEELKVEELTHVKNIILLASECGKDEEKTLLFNPFLE